MSSSIMYPEKSSDMLSKGGDSFTLIPTPSYHHTPLVYSIDYGILHKHTHKNTHKQTKKEQT